MHDVILHQQVRQWIIRYSASLTPPDALRNSHLGSQVTAAVSLYAVPAIHAEFSISHRESDTGLTNDPINKHYVKAKV